MIRPILRTLSALITLATPGYEISSDSPPAWLAPALLALAYALAVVADRIDHRRRRHRTPLTHTITWAPILLLLILVAFRTLITTDPLKAL